MTWIEYLRENPHMGQLLAPYIDDGRGQVQYSVIHMAEAQADPTGPVARTYQTTYPAPAAAVFTGSYPTAADIAEMEEGRTPAGFTRRDDAGGPFISNPVVTTAAATAQPVAVSGTAVFTPTANNADATAGTPAAAKWIVAALAAAALVLL